MGRWGLRPNLPTVPPETFDEFKDSFSYGSRTDLAFKFLKRLPADEAARFFAGLLDALGATLDDGHAQRLVDLAYEWQARGYAPAAGAPRPWTYEDGPFTRMAMPLVDARVALLTSSGHFAAGDDPRPFGVEAMTQSEAIDRIAEFLREPPVLSEIPAATPAGELRVRHGGYDIRGAQADADVAFPLARLRELAGDGVIGGVADPAFSFVGATSQKRLLTGVDAWVDRMRETGADAVLLVPV